MTKREKYLLQCAIDRLADKIEFGHLLSCTMGHELLNAACDKIEKLEAGEGQVRVHNQVMQDASQSVQENGGARLITQQENRIKWFEEFYERIDNDSPDVVAQILKDMGGEFS